MQIRPPTAAGGAPAPDGFRWIGFLFLFLHAAKMLSWFRDVNFSAPLPILNVDYAQYYGRALRMHHFLAASGRIWGYDPFDMAGYISGPFLEVGTHLLTLVAHALVPFVSLERSLLFLEISGLAVAPFFILLAVRAAGGTRLQAWSAFGFTIPLYGFIDPFSATMIRIGLWGFMISSFAAPLQVALAWRWMNRGGALNGAAFTLVTAAIFGLHPASLVVVAIPNALLFLTQASRAGVRRSLVTLILGAIAVAANLYWIRPFVAFSEWKADAPYFLTAGLSDLWDLMSPVGKDILYGMRFVALLYVVGLAGGALVSLFRRDRRMWIVIAGWLGWLFLVSFFGSAFPVLSTLQPGRNSFPFWVLCGVLAGMSAPTAILARQNRRWFASALFLLSVGIMFTRASLAAWYFPPLTNQLPKGQEESLAYLKTADVQGRVMLECVDTALPHMADIAPWRTGKIFFGGQHPGNFLTARSSLFSGMYKGQNGFEMNNPVAFGHPLKTMGQDTFARYLATYNVGMIAARSRSMNAEMERLQPLLGSPVRAGDYRFYSVLARSGWLAEGSGTVRFDYDRIQINEASTGKIVVKAHWIKTFKADPPVPLEPVYLLDDPVPFISVDNARGAKDILIYNAGL